MYVYVASDVFKRIVLSILLKAYLYTWSNNQWRIIK